MSASQRRPFWAVTIDMTIVNTVKDVYAMVEGCSKEIRLTYGMPLKLGLGDDNGIDQAFILRGKAGHTS